MDLEQSNRNLRDEIAKLKQKLSALEPKPSAADEADDKAKLRNVFTAFDRDNDGFLSRLEFQDLAFQLDACVTEVVRGQAQDGKISFDKFHAWWRVPAAYVRDDPGNKRLRLLKMKLQTRPYFTLISNIAASLAQPPPPAPKKEKEDEVISARVAVSLGQFDAAMASARLQLVRDEPRGRALRDGLKIAQSSAVFSAALLLRPGATEAQMKVFQNEVVTEVIDSLKKDLKYTSWQMEEKRDAQTGQRLFWVHIIWEHRSKVEAMKEAFSALNLGTVDLNIDLSQRPGDPNDGFIKARASLCAEFSRLGVRLLLAKLARREKEGMRRILNLLAGFGSAGVRLDLGDAGEVFKQFMVGPLQQFQGWASIRPMAVSFILEEFNENAFNAYLAALSVLVGPHMATFSFEDSFFQATFENLNLADVLPTKADLEALEAEGNGNDSDDEEEWQAKPPKKKAPPYELL